MQGFRVATGVTRSQRREVHYQFLTALAARGYCGGVLDLQLDVLDAELLCGRRVQPQTRLLAPFATGFVTMAAFIFSFSKYTYFSKQIMVFHVFSMFYHDFHSF